MGKTVRWGVEQNQDFLYSFVHYNYTINDFLKFYLYVFDTLEVRLNQTLELI